MDKPSIAFRALAAAVAVLLALGAIALVAGPGRGMRADIAEQRRDVDRQVGLLRDQLATTQALLEVTRAQLESVQQQRELVASQLEVARRQLDEVERQRRNSDELLRVARATLAHVQSIDRKTPDASAAPAPAPAPAGQVNP